MPTFAEFLDPKVPLSEVASFLDLAGRLVPEDKPYAWSNTVRTIDGIIDFQQDGSTSSDVAMRHVPSLSHGATADWRLLTAGWSYADAVLVSGALLREDASDDWVVSDPDLLVYRQSVLRRKHAQPIQAVLSRKCDIDFGVPLFKRKDVSVVVLTSKEGMRRGIERAMEVFGGAMPSRLRFAEIDEGDMGIDLRSAFRYLRKAFDIEYLDVACGGQVLRQLIDLKLVDELRFTLSGAFAGRLNPSGIARPLHFAENEGHRRFSKDDCPLLRWIGIRTIGDHHIFFRGEWVYRH